MKYKVGGYYLPALAKPWLTVLTEQIRVELTDEEQSWALDLSFNAFLTLNNRLPTFISISGNT